MILYRGINAAPKMPKRAVNRSVDKMSSIGSGIKSGYANIGLLTINGIKGGIANTI